MKSICKSIIALFAFIVVALAGTAVFSAAPSEVFAQSNYTLTYDEVNSLEQLREVPVEQIASWAQYDSRKYGLVTSVKNQGNTNLCWVYSSLSAMETNILRQGITDKTADNLDLDEVEFAKALKGKWDDPLDLADGSKNQKKGNSVAWNNLGSMPMAAQFAARGQGVYEAGEVVDEEPYERYSSYLLRNAVTCDENVDDIKKLIATYGGVAFTFNSGYIQYNYYYATGLNDHACFIVGWDDTVNKNLFNNGTKPAIHDGAWIVKNSYGTGSFIDGYFYLSYDSKMFEITAFDMGLSDEYDFCYNYSDKIYDSSSYNTYTPVTPDDAKFAAIYKAQSKGVDKELLKAVSVGAIGNNIEITVSVYTDIRESAVNFSKATEFNPEGGTLAVRTVYTAPYGGIRTIPLPETITLNKDSYFTILVQVSGGKIVNDNMAHRTGATFTYAWDEGKWVDMSYFLPPQYNGVLCIKALTVSGAEGDGNNDKEKIIDISDGILGLSDTSFTYTGLEHTPEVTLTLAGETVSPDNYNVEYENNISAGTATVKVEGKENYTGSLKTTFVIAKAARSEFKAQLKGWTYGQMANSPSVSDFGLEKGEVTYSYGKSESGPFGTECPEKAGIYYVKAEMSETDNYESAVAISEFTIRKAEAPKLPEEFEKLNITGDMKVLSDIKLPSGWAWQIPKTQLVAGKMQVTVVYVGNDCESYEKTVFGLELDIPELDNTESPDVENEPPAVEPDDPDKKEPEKPPVSDTPDDEKEQQTGGPEGTVDDGKHETVAPPDTGDEGDNTVAVAVGVTVGVVGAGAIGVGAFWFIRRRRRL